jgi:GntR family transcriptional regulator, transcriptional repressor for pyruvate dehydrogenase complex
VTTLGPVQRPSVPDQVFTRLCDLIVAGEYAPGDRLPTQRMLASEFGVNMASIREALKRLEQLRLIEVRHGDATRVLDWRRSGLEALALLGEVDGQIVQPLFEARRLVLTEVARLAARRRTAAQAERIVELAGDVARAADDEAAQLADWAFVSAVVEAAGNLVFQLIGTSVRELYLSHAAKFRQIVTHREELSPLYAATAEAIRAGAPDAAAEAMSALSAAHEQRMVDAL